MVIGGGAMSVPIEDRMSRYLSKLDPAVSGQGGHDATFHAASVLVHGFGLSVEHAWPFALRYNARCTPPWNEHDLHRKLTEALRKPSDKPRGHLLKGKILDDSFPPQADSPPPNTSHNIEN